MNYCVNSTYTCFSRNLDSHSCRQNHSEACCLTKGQQQVSGQFCFKRTEWEAFITTASRWRKPEVRDCQKCAIFRKPKWVVRGSQCQCLCVNSHATLIKRGENTPLVQSWVPKTAGKTQKFKPSYMCHKTNKQNTLSLFKTASQKFSGRSLVI